ncbi:MAG: hypothetical protein IT512_09455 [Rhodocyclaceae bacterium]|nr:hypothetical protein [Rhodocyclaceae bacterium]
MESILKGLWLRDRKTEALYRVTWTGEGMIHYRGESGSGRIVAEAIHREFEILPGKPQEAPCN